MQKPCFHPYVFRIWISASNWRHMTYGLEGYTTDPRLILARSIAMASPSRRWRRRRRRQRRRTRTVPLGVFLYHTTLPAARDWAELPVDAILQVFRWLDHVDILMGAGLASRSWRAAARDEPALWRRIDMRGFACLPYWQRHRRDTVRAMAREAVRRSAGRCEEFWSKVGGDDEVLRFLADQWVYMD